MIAFIASFVKRKYTKFMEINFQVFMDAPASCIRPSSNGLSDYF
jgi:hypothetical protein